MDSYNRLPSYQQYHNQNDTGTKIDLLGKDNDDRENAAEIDPLLLRESIRNSLLETSNNNSSTSSKRSSSFTKARPISKQARTTALLVALLVLFLLAVLPHLPTADEMDLAREYELSWWNGLSRLRSAQHLADMNRLSFLASGGSHHHHRHDKLVTEIKDHNGAKHYMEPMDGCEATVVIVRHCEKGNIREHCAYVGFERSVYLATLFGDKDHERWPAPSYIFAQGPGQRRNERKMNFREIETVGPVAQKAGVKIDDR